MNSLLDAVGQQEHLYEMFVDMTEDLFQQILAAITQGNTDDSLILDFFNSEFAAAAIITHFRVSLTIEPPLFMLATNLSPSYSQVPGCA